MDTEDVLNHQEIKETTETMDEISDQEKSIMFAEKLVLIQDLTLDGEETKTMNGKKRKVTKSDTADGKMVRKNSKNLDGNTLVLGFYQTFLLIHLCDGLILVSKPLVYFWPRFLRLGHLDHQD